MYLAVNTFVYEVVKVPIREALIHAHRLGFRFIDVAAYQSGNPVSLTRENRREIVKTFENNGLQSSQLVMLGTRDLASSDKSARDRVLAYMKRCADFQLELGGKQVLVCWGGGIYEHLRLKEECWINSVRVIQEYGRWCYDKGVLVSLELDPHVYYIVNNLEKMARMLESVEMPNVFVNIDIAHLYMTRETPKTIEKVSKRVLHVHLTDTNGLAHTNSILGTGEVEFKSYIDALLEMGIEENCEKYGEVAVAAIEVGEPGGVVDNPDRWVKESLSYIRKKLPKLTL